MDKSEEFTFKVRQLATVLALDRNGIIVNPDRFIIENMGDSIRVLLDVATQEEDIMETPSDWWQHFKLRWFPRWLKKRYPVKMSWISAIHQFPELDIPHNVLGREFVHLKVIDSWKLQDKMEEKKNGLET